jgi:probable O-glycosylation ligase (exosortase A-associated)
VRDIVLTAFILGSLPFILRNPFIGLLMWVWVGIMNPHRFTWGFAYNMPFAQIIAICTVASMLLHQDKRFSMPKDKVVIFLVLFLLWLGVSPFFSFHPDREFAHWIEPVKIQVMCLVALFLVGRRDQLHNLVWVLALSIGLFGIKGGIFTIAHGGAYRVWGPPGSFIADNNALALAIIMTMPLFRYLQLYTENRWIRRACVVAMLLCFISALGSYSRGALLAVLAMGLFLFVKSRKKGLIVILILVCAPIVFTLMPEAWFDRMSTIETYQQDASALGRINAWHMCWNLAVARFPIGGGFVIYEPDVFARYAPEPWNIHAAHSIYFQVLGEHGFIGLALYLLIFGLSWRNGSWIVRNTKNVAGLEWARDLASMCQVSLAGFAVGGAFLSLTYFDLPYYLVIILIVLRQLVARQLAGSASDSTDKASAGTGSLVAPDVAKKVPA